MEQDFFVFIAYKEKKIKFKVKNPNDSLDTLMENLKRTNLFDMPSIDQSGAPLDYFFGKVDDGGKNILNPKIGKTEMHLSDYNVKNGDTLVVTYSPMPGAINN